MTQRPRRRTTRILAVSAVALAAVAALATTQFASAADEPGAGTAAGATETVTETIEVTGTFDGEGRRFVGGGPLGGDGQDEGQDPLFRLADGATLVNVTLGAPAADGVHCQGSCTIRDVNWEDVGEDAATFRGTGATVLIEGGSAAAADDKVFQDNRGAGGSVTIRDFTVSDFGKLYRSCGNCSTQAARTVTLENITATAPGDVLAGVNANFGDRLTISGATVGDGIGLCDIFEANDTGDEPTKIASDPDGVTCVVTD